jgi:hypothetical protein
MALYHESVSVMVILDFRFWALVIKSSPFAPPAPSSPSSPPSPPSPYSLLPTP